MRLHAVLLFVCASSVAWGDASLPITQTQLDVLNKLIEATPDGDPNRPDMMFRRATMYLQLADHYAALPGEEPHKKSELWQLAGVKELVLLVDEPRWSGWPRLDEAEFMLADRLTRIGKEEAARKYFKKLLVERPSSKFVPHAFLSFGEYYFAKNDLENALKFYDKVLTFPNSEVADYARYKSAWCYFNQSDYKQALAEFTEISLHGRDEKLVREARKDLVRTYVHVGDRFKAREFFAKVAPPDEAERMATQLDQLLGQ
jgi:tetratricopeptide (TPR) repeat protein